MTITIDTQTPALLTCHDLQALLRCGRTKAYATTQQDDFPAPLVVGGSYLWVREEVAEWLTAQRATQRRRKRSVAPVSTQEALPLAGAPVARQKRVRGAA